MSADEAWVEVRPHDNRWPALFEAESAEIRAALGVTTSEVVHFGSTAVPGLVAKPIIDILIGVTDDIESSRLIETLDRLGYEYLGEDGRRPGRFFWRKRDRNFFNVSSVPFNGALWRSNLAVRDFLRANDDWAHRYSDVKVRAARSSGASMLRYQDAKRSFVDELRAAALDWYGAR